MKKVMLIILVMFSLVLLTSCEDIKIISAGEQLSNMEIATKERVQQLFDEANPETVNRYDIFGGILKSNSSDASGLIVEESMPAMAGANGDLETSYDEANPNSSGETSQTNVIIEGIDEADYIKNDSRYLYYVPGYNYYRRGNIINIIDSETDEVKSLELKDGYVRGLYLNEQGLTVIYQETVYDDEITIPRIYDYYYYRSYHQNLVIQNYDNTDPFNLVLKKEIRLENTTYQDSRMIDNKLYLFGNLYLITDRKVCDMDFQIDGEDKRFSFEDLYILDGGKYYTTAISTYSIDLSAEKEEDEIINFKAFYGMAYSYNTEFHLNFDNLYIYTSMYFSYYGSKQKTKIMRLDLEDFSLKGVIEQDGYLCDVYAINEYDGVLRVATTYTGEKGYMDYHNLLVTYDVKEDKFEKISDIEFAEGEKIYSTKFINNIGYIVTYLYIDPLFEFDLTDPANIEIKRSLKSPGVSDYLDYVNEDFIVGIGRMTQEHGTYATSEGIKVSLFSLDNEEMVEEDTYVYGTSYSSATSNHKVIVKLKESLCYYFPIEIYDGRNAINGFTGVRINLEERKVEYLGAIDMNYYGARLVVINGKIYAVGNEYVAVALANQELSVIKEIK